MATDFSSIPILDYTLLASPETRAEFVSQLLAALTNVGFFYLSNAPIFRSGLVTKVVDYAPKFFDLNRGPLPGGSNAQQQQKQPA